MTLENYQLTQSYLYKHLLRRTIVPLMLMLASPNWTLLLSYMVIEKKGSLLETFIPSGNANYLSVIGDAWAVVDWLDLECWTIVLGLFGWAILGMLLLPGKPYYGPLTRGNFRPVYYHTAVPYYLLTLALASPAICYYSVLPFYFKFTTFTAILILTGLIVLVLLYIKGKLSTFFFIAFTQTKNKKCCCRLYRTE